MIKVDEAMSTAPQAGAKRARRPKPLQKEDMRQGLPGIRPYQTGPAPGVDKQNGFSHPTLSHAFGLLRNHFFSSLTMVPFSPHLGHFCGLQRPSFFSPQLEHVNSAMTALSFHDGIWCSLNRTSLTPNRSITMNY